MKVGDYVRTKKGIAKIIDRINDPTNYFDKFWVCDRYLELNDDTEYIHEQDVVKSSPNIIDLIEVGDLTYVDISPDNCSGIIVPRIAETENELKLFKQLLEKDWIIKSIITHEQLGSIKYKVGE